MSCVQKLCTVITKNDTSGTEKAKTIVLKIQWTSKVRAGSSPASGTCRKVIMLELSPFYMVCESLISELIIQIITNLNRNATFSCVQFGVQCGVGYKMVYKFGAYYD